MALNFTWHRTRSERGASEIGMIVCEIAPMSLSDDPIERSSPFWLVIGALFGLCWCGSYLWMLSQQAATTDYRPVAVQEMHAYAVGPARYRRSSLGRVAAKYSYLVGGKEMRGTNVTAGDFQLVITPGRGPADAIAARLNTNPTVYVSPRDPSTTVLVRGFEPWMFTMLPLPVGLFVFCSTGVWPEPRSDRGRAVRDAIAGASGTLVMSFAVLFGYCLLTDQPHTWPFAIAPWACALLIGPFVPKYYAWRSAR
jgi:hypothetical protein